MIRKTFNLLVLLALMFGLVATVRPQPVLADTCDGGSGDDIINCVDAGDPTDGDVNGGAGDDTITLGGDADTGVDVNGDEISDAIVTGGDDTIVAEDAGSVCGDGLEGDIAEGGNDTIDASASFVGGDCVGADIADGGNDVIDANAGTVCGDSLEGDIVGGGNDTINASAGFVGGDCAEGGIATGGSDVINAVANQVCGDNLEADIATGGNDTINASATLVQGDCLYGSIASGGSDYIETSGYALAVQGDVITGADFAQGGDDQLVINNLWVDAVLGDAIYDGGSAYGGNDTITINGNASFVNGDGLYNNSDAIGGDDTIVVNGYAGYVQGDGVYGGGAGFGASACYIDCDSQSGGNDTIIINGAAGSVVGDGVLGCAGNDNIIINGDVYGDVYGDDGDGCYSGKTIVIDDGLYDNGNDVVTIGAGGVSYSQVCGDIDVTTVERRQGTVGGIINGDNENSVVGYDILAFNVVTPNENDSALADYLAGFDPSSGSVEVGGATYNYQNFDEFQVNLFVYSEGATRMYDDGVTLAFSLADGIAVCNGPSGLRAGLIDYGRLTAGQREFGANGFVVTLEDVGSQHFKVHVWKDGVEQFDDANGDGVADDLFVFGF